MNFIQLWLKGEVTKNQIHDFVDIWHMGNSDKELYEFLGMSWGEYSTWLTKPYKLLSILLAHKKKKE